MILNSVGMSNQTLGRCSLGLARFTNVIFILMLPGIIQKYLKKMKKEDEQVWELSEEYFHALVRRNLRVQIKK